MRPRPSRRAGALHGSTWQELEHWSGWSGKHWCPQPVDLSALEGPVILRAAGWSPSAT